MTKTHKITSSMVMMNEECLFTISHSILILLKDHQMKLPGSIFKANKIIFPTSAGLACGIYYQIGRKIPDMHTHNTVFPWKVCCLVQHTNPELQ